MAHKYLKLSVLIFAIIVLFAGCAHSVKESDIVGKTYTYEKGGFGGDFNIQIKDDGTFLYSEGLLSSYLGFGNWTLEGDTLLLSDDVQGHLRDNFFTVDGTDLVFQAENSTNFPYLTVADGERFSESPPETE